MGLEKVQILCNLVDSPVKYNRQNHTFGEGKFIKHCAREKACFYFDWLTNERGLDEGGSTLVIDFDYLSVDNSGRDTEPFHFERRNNKNREPISAAKN